MFTKKVTDDENFFALSSSAQALYLHLSMAADDDGFCNQISVSMFKAHASIQDLEALLEKRYIYQFENGVIVIKHWRMANALRKDRYTPTAFQEELSKLDIKDNGSYTWLPNGCQLVAVDKNSIDKNRLDKDSIESDVTSDVTNDIIPSYSISNSISNSNKSNKYNIDDIIDSFDFDEETKEVIKEWLTYKKEKRQEYKETGAKSLIKQIYNRCQEYGYSKVRDVIEQSMGSNYQGIVWDWLKEKGIDWSKV